MLLLVPPSADRARVVDLQLGGLEPAVGVWSGLGRAIMASDTFCFTKPKRKYGQQRALFSSFDARKRDVRRCARRQSLSSQRTNKDYRVDTKKPRETRAQTELQHSQAISSSADERARRARSTAAAARRRRPSRAARRRRRRRCRTRSSRRRRAATPTSSWSSRAVSCAERHHPVYGGRSLPCFPGGTVAFGSSSAPCFPPCIYTTLSSTG